MTLRKKKGPDWRLVRFLLRNMAIGVVSGWIFIAALVHYDVGGLGGLLAGAQSRVLATVMLLIVMTITWGSAAMGTAIFLLPRDEDQGDGAGGNRAPALCLRTTAIVLKDSRR